MWEAFSFFEEKKTERKNKSFLISHFRNNIFFLGSINRENKVLLLVIFINTIIKAFIDKFQQFYFPGPTITERTRHEEMPPAASSMATCIPCMCVKACCWFWLARKRWIFLYNNYKKMFFRITPIFSLPKTFFLHK